MTDPLRLLAARLEAVAEFVEEGLGIAAPSKYLARQAAIAMREIAATARAEAQLGHFPPDDEGGGEDGTRWMT